MADFAKQMEQIVVRAHRLRKSIKAVCVEAGVAPSTWSRWQAREVAPKQETIDRLNDALDRFESETA